MNDFESELILKKLRRAEGTGPVSRILSWVGILVIVLLLSVLVRDKQYVSAIIIGALGFTRIGAFIIIGFCIYFAVIGYWLGFVILTVDMLVGYVSSYFAQKNIKTSLYSSKATVDPFEGMLDSLPIIIAQAILLFLAVVTAGVISIICWALFGIAVIFQIGRFYHRLASPWRSLHYPLIIRYAATSGFEAGLSQSQNREFDIYNALGELVKSVLPDLSDVEIVEGIDAIRISMDEFSDRELLESEFKKKNPNLNQAKLDEFLGKVSIALKDQNAYGLMVRWFIAEIVERDYGLQERGKYLYAVVTGNAD